MQVLEIDLYNGNNEIIDLDAELKDVLQYLEDNGTVVNGDKKVYMGEEVMYVVL